MWSRPNNYLSCPGAYIRLDAGYDSFYESINQLNVVQKVCPLIAIDVYHVGLS